MADYKIENGNIEDLLGIGDQPMQCCMSHTPQKATILPSTREPKQVDKMAYEGLELNVALYELEKISAADPKIVEEGIFQLSEKEKVVARGNLYVIVSKDQKSLVLDNVKTLSGSEVEKALDALRKYSSIKEYKELVVPTP